jgi:hypothetical protein
MQTTMEVAGLRKRFGPVVALDGMTFTVAPGQITARCPRRPPRWLRLTRSGDTITGYDSADGTHWTRVGTAHLAGLPATVQAGLFATSPAYQHLSAFFGGTTGQIGPSLATGAFDRVSLTGARPGGVWTGDNVGDQGGFGPQTGQVENFRRAGDSGYTALALGLAVFLLRRRDA